MSALEKLPTELIENIFLFSMNLDLPRASPIICGKLSSEHVYVRTVIAGFNDSWLRGYNDVMDGEDKLIDADAEIEESSYQSAILRCRWATISVLIRAEDTWFKRMLRLRNGKLPSNEVIVPAYADITPFPYEKLKIEQERYQSDLIADYFEQDFARFFREAEKKDGLTRYHRLWPNWTSPTTFPMCGQTQIPEYLLKGPWNMEMVKHLFYVVLRGAQIDFVGSTNGEVALSGLGHAVSTGNMYILYLFCHLQVNEHVDLAFIKWAIWNVGDNNAEVLKRLLSTTPIMQEPRNRNEVVRELMKFNERAELDSDADKIALAAAALSVLVLR